jgi:hypothetical protein
MIVQRKKNPLTKSELNFCLTKKTINETLFFQRTLHEIYLQPNLLRLSEFRNEISCEFFRMYFFLFAVFFSSIAMKKKRTDKKKKYLLHFNADQNTQIVFLVGV